MSPSKLLFSMEEMVKLLNPKIIGMRNYYARLDHGYGR